LRLEFEVAGGTEEIEKREPPTPSGRFLRSSGRAGWQSVPDCHLRFGATELQESWRVPKR